MSAAARIQTYLRESARRALDPVPVPPFTAFFHPRDDLVYFNYAIPDEPVGGDLAEPLTRLRAVFAERSRTPRFEFIKAFAPGLASALRSEGFTEELDTPLMICSAAELARGPAVPGLTVEAIDGHSPVELVRDSLTIPRRAFGKGDEEPASPEDARDTQQRFAASHRLVGSLDGRRVAVATAVSPLAGLSEIAGVAVQAEFRGRGIGSAMTAAAAEAAFAAGAKLAFLTPGNEGAMRIYERAGFRRQETMLHYVAGP